MIRIAMISGPRNISTTMMRAFENRSDTIVHDEPFYACYLNQSGARHPMREDILNAQSVEWAEVTNTLNSAYDENSEYSFEKHIGFHFSGAPLNWIEGARAFHLIRNPRAMVASYANKFDDVSPIIDSYRMQRQIDQRLDTPCPVIDARDVLQNPEAMLRTLCEALDISFSKAMLSWPKGPRDSDGVWGPHWYDGVIASTGFNPYSEKPISLSPALEKIADACMEDYEFFHGRRLTI